MRAIIAQPDSDLIWGEVADPVAVAGEVVIDVVTAGVNRADVLQAAGQYPPPPGASPILGLEVSGHISELGAGVTAWSIGQPVCALLAGGGYAERVAVPAGQVMPMPDGVGLHDAAGLPEVACTVWSNLGMTASITAGQTVLFHGGASGIGTHGIQLAHALGCRVAVTAGSAEKLSICRDLGADILINYRDEDFVASLKAQTDGRGADVILDLMGAAYLSRNIDALAPDGRLVVIGFQGGLTADLNLGALMAKRAGVISTALRSRPVDGPSGKAAVVAATVDRVWPLIAAGKIRPVIGTELPIADAAAAHQLLTSSGTHGKVLLRVRD